MAKITFQTDQGAKVVNFDGTPTPDDVNEVASKLGLSGSSNTTNQPQEKQSDNWFGGLLDDVFKPINTFGATFQTVGEALESTGLQAGGTLVNKVLPGAGNGLLNASNAGMSDVYNQEQNGVSTVGGGTVLPIGAKESAQAGQEIEQGKNATGATAKALVKTAGELVGTGAQALAYTAATPLSFGVLTALGAGTTDLSQGKGSGTAALDGLIQGVTGGATAGLLNIAGSRMVPWIGKQVMADPMLGSVANTVKDFVTGLFNKAPQVLSKSSDGNLAKLVGGVLTPAYRALKQNFSDTMDSTFKAFTTAAKTPVEDATQALIGQQEEQRAFIAQKYAPLRAEFSKFYQDTSTKIPEFSNTKSAITDAQNYMKSLVTKNDLDQEISRISGYKPENFGRIGDSQMSAFQEEAANNIMQRKSPALYNYTQTMQKQISTDGGLTMGQLAHSAQSAPVDSTQGGTSQMNSIAQSLWEDGRSYLKTNAPKKYDAWNSLAQKWSDVKQNFDTTFKDKFINAATMGNFVDDIKSGKASPDQLQNFLKGLSTESKKTASQMMFNTILDRANSVATNQGAEAGGKFIQGYTDKFGQVLDPEHLTALQHIAEFGQGNLQDTVDHLRTLMGVQSEEGAGSIAEEGKVAMAKDKLNQLTAMQQHIANIDNTGIMKAANAGNYTKVIEQIGKSSVLATKNPDLLPSLMSMLTPEQGQGLVKELLNSKVSGVNRRQMMRGILALLPGYLGAAGYHGAIAATDAMNNLTNKQIDSAVMQLAGDPKAPQFMTGNWFTELAKRIIPNLLPEGAAQESSQLANGQ